MRLLLESHEPYLYKNLKESAACTKSHFFEKDFKITHPSKSILLL